MWHLLHLCMAGSWQFLASQMDLVVVGGGLVSAWGSCLTFGGGTCLEVQAAPVALVLSVWLPVACCICLVVLLMVTFLLVDVSEWAV